MVNVTRDCGADLERVFTTAMLDILRSSVYNGLNLDGSTACLGRTLCHGETIPGGLSVRYWTVKCLVVLGGGEGGREGGHHSTVLTLETAALAFSLLGDHSSDFQTFLNLLTEEEDWPQPHREMRRERNFNCAKLFSECKV